MKNLRVPAKRYFQSKNSMWLLTAIVCICSCGDQEPVPTAPVVPSGKGEAAVQRLDGTQVGVSLLNRTHQFYQDLEEGLRAEAARYGIELLIESAEGDSNKQVDQLDNFVAQGVNAIVVCPCDTESIGSTVNRVNKAEIPVFTADIAAAGGDVVCHIASDNVQGGRLAGEAMVQALGPDGGKIVIVDDPTRSSVVDRVKGFLEVIQNHPEVQVVGRQSGEGWRDRAHDTMENLLQAHTALDGVFGINDDTALGALGAIESAGRKGEMVIIGYDGTTEARRHIDAGDIYADAVQFPDRIGRLTVKAIADYLNGEEVPKTMPVECGLYRSPEAKRRAGEG